MIEKIKNKQKLLSIIIRANYKSENIEFFTPSDFSQQLGYMNRPKGYVVQAHLHKPVKRQIMNTREVLIVKKGKIRTYFYDNKKKYVCSKIIKTGDILLLVNGGHGFEMLEKSEVFEVKQGPYKKNKDKILF